MEILFIIISTTVWISVYLYYTTSLKETKTSIRYHLAGQAIWISAGYGGAEIIKTIAKAIFH